MLVFKRVLSILSVAALVTFSTCDVLTPGLGEKVDLRLPVVTITNPSTDGLYLKGAVTVSGSASDDLKVASLSLSYQSSVGTELINLSPDQTNWTQVLPVLSPNGLKEGQNTITLSITDGDGNTVKATRLVYVDNYAPLVLVESPLTKGALASTYSDYIDLMGKAYDDSPLSSVTVQLLKADGTVLSNAEIADGTNSWSKRFLLNPAKGTAPGSSDAYRTALTDGTYRYQVVATDAAGNTNTYYFHRTDIIAAMSPGALYPSITELGRVEITGVTGSSGVSQSELVTAQKPFQTGGQQALLPDFKYEGNPLISFDFGSITAGAPATSNALSIGASMTITADPPPGGGAILPSSIFVKIWDYASDPNVDPALVTLNDTDHTSDTVDNIKVNIRGASAIISMKLKNASTNLAPNSYKIRVFASTDQGSNGNSNIEEFLVDSEAPVFDEQYDSGSGMGIGTSTLFKTGAFKFNFSGSHSTALDRIEIEQSFNSGTSTLVETIPLSTSSITNKLSASLPSGAPTDGFYSYKITLFTSSGKSSIMYRSLSYDQLAPSVQISNFAPVVGAQTVNGNVNLSVSASDTNGIQEVRYWILPNPSALPVWSDAGYSSWTLPPYNGTVDTTLLSGGNYVIYVLALDKAGNINTATPASKNFIVDQNSDMPTIDIQSLNESGTAVDNLLPSSLQINGVSSDDDGIDHTTFAIALDGSSTFNAITNPPSSDTTTASFRHTFSGLSEGAHTFKIRVKDVNGLTYTSNTINLAVDSANPSLSVSTPVINSYVNADFAIAGTASDASGLQGGVVTIKEASNSFTSPVSSGNFSFGVTVLGGSPHVFGTAGAHSVTVEATDIFGKKTSQVITYTVDIVAPSITITIPAANSWLRGTNFAVTGTSSDAISGTATLEYRLDKNNDGDFNDAGESWNSLSGTSSWNGTISLTSVPEGNGQTFEVRATDNAGNVSAPLARNFGLDQSDPGLTETSLASASQFKSGLFTIGGVLNDTNQLASISVTESKDGASATTVYSSAESGVSQSYVTGNLPSSGLATGTYDYVITVTDIAGNTSQINRQVKIDLSEPSASIADPTPAQVLLGSAYLINGTAADVGPAGIAMVEFRIDANNDSDFADGGLENWTQVSGTSSWSYNLSLTGLGEGNRTIEVRATDAAGNVQSAVASRTFMIDQANPSLNETNVSSMTQPVYLSTGFALSGTASDSNALASISINQIKDSGAPVAIPSMPSVSGTSSSWSVTSLPRDPLNPTNQLVSDGVYEYQITITDAAGKTSSIVRTVTVDTQAPDLSFSSFGPIVSGIKVNGIVSFNASAIDNNQIAGIRRWVLPQASPAPAFGDAGYTAWSSPPYSAQINTTSLTDGQSYTVWVIARDRAGNESIISQSMTIDQSSDNPSIALSNLDDTIALAVSVDSTHNMLENNAKIQGILSDDDWIDATSIVVRIDANNDGDFSDGGVENFTSVTSHGSSGTLVNFEHSISGLADGIYNFEIRVSDDATKKIGLSSTSKTSSKVYFAIDKQNPSLAYSAPSNFSLKKTNFTLSGTASDANGLSPAMVSVTDEASTVLYMSPVSAGTFSEPIDVTVLVEGLHTWTLSVTDRFNKTTTTSLSFTRDTIAPLVTITSPGASSWNSGSTLTLQGTATDVNGVASISYSLDSTDGSDGTWNSAVGTTNWSALVSLSSLGEGSKTLWVKASDQAGNISGAISTSFGIDQTSASSTLASVDTLSNVIFASSSASSASSSAKALFTLSGTATDSNAVASVVITEKKGSNAATTVFNTTGINAASAPWSVSSLPSGGLVDDLYLYTITITDVAGNTTQYTRTVRVDQTAPSISIGDPASDGSVLVGSAYSLSGTSSDASSGVSLVEVSTDGGTTWANATGTTNWNYLLNLTAMGEGAHSVKVRSTDAALNVSSVSTRSFYIDQAAPVISISSPINNDVYNADFTLAGTASDANLSAVDVKINSGAYVAATGITSYTYSVSLASLSTGINTITARATDIAGRTTTTSIDVYKDQVAPSISFNNADSSGTSVLGETNPKLLGTLGDATSVASAQSYLESYDYGTTGWTMVENWTSLGSTGNVKVFNFTKDLGSSGLALADGKYRISIKTADGANPTANQSSGVPATANESVVFTIDRNNPNLALTAPSSGSFQKQNFTVSGTSSDNNTISSVLIKIDSNNFASGTVSASTSDNYATWSATASTSGLSAGTHTIYVQSTDGSGRTTVASRDFTFDNTLPSVSVIDPLSGSAVNGAITLKGTSSDANAVTLVQLRLGKDVTWNNLAGVYSWQQVFSNVDTYANFTYATDTGDTDGDNVVDGGETFTGVWRFYINIRATDAAGNVKLYGDNNDDGDTLDAGDTPFYLDLDPSQDAPQTTIYQPLDNQTVGGATRVYGIATDDDAVYRVEMSIDLNNDGDYNDTSDYWNYSGTGTPTLASDGDTNDRFENEATWYPVTGTTNWYQIINQFGEYNAASAGLTRTIKVRVRAVDTKNGINAGVNGNAKEITITFDNTIPIVENLQIDTDTIDNNGNETNYASGLRVSGTFYVVADIKDESGITQIDKVEDGPLSGTTRIDNNGSITTFMGFTGGYYKYRVRVPINSTTIGSGVFNNTSGTYAMRFRATDNSTPNPFTTDSYITVQVDNYFPTAAYTNAQAVVGTNYKIQGTATDVGAGSGIVQGIDKVIGWFTKSGNVYNPLLSNTSVSLAANSTSLSVKDMTAAGAIQNISLPNNGYRVVIDKTTEVGVSDSAPNGDVDGYLESLTVSGNTYDWWSEINTTNMPDGPMTYNYVVIDKAGNATYYTQTLFIRNNGPTITSVTLGTDLNGDGDVLDSGEQSSFSSGYTATGFTVRNNRLYVSVGVTGGNGTMYYSVKYPNSSGTEQNGSINSSSLAISNFASIPDGTVNGSTFAIRVYDSTPGTTPGVDSLESSQTINLTIDNIDNTNPIINISPFGQKYSIGNDDTAKTLGAVSTYSENIYEVTGTLYGHVEYAADSLYNGADADLSGQVIFKGKAQDNQRLQRISATIPGFNGGSGAGVEFDIWTYSGGALSGTGWTFAQDGSEYLTESKGHVFNWNLTLNTALISGAASNNVAVQVKAYDYNGTPNSATNSLTVDVVPYISSIVRTGLNTNRTKYGAYPLYRGETQVAINGFNLLASSTQDANNWVRVYNSAGTAYDTFSNAQLTTVNTSRDYMELTIPNALRSGQLRVSVNGVLDVNAVNDNTKTYNKEDDGSGINASLWNDNRYLNIWSVNNNFNTSDGAVYPSMSMLADGTLYGAWITYASSQTWLGTTGAAPTLQWGIFDPPEFTDLNVDTTEGATLKYSLAFVANHYGGGGWGNAPLDPPSAGFMSVRTAASPNLTGTSYGNAFGYGIESLNLNQQLWQFYRPKTVRVNVGTDAQDRIHSVYYDDRTKSLKYSFLNDDTGGMIKGWMVLDGPTDAEDTTTTATILGATATRGSQTTATVAAWANNASINTGDTVALKNGTNVYYRLLTGWTPASGAMSWAGNVPTTCTSIDIMASGSGGRGQVTNGLTASTKAGEYAAIDADEDGLPVVVYYDTAAQTLRLARADSTTPTSPSNWTRQSVFGASDTLKTFTGQHVAIKFDSAGGLHVVAFRSSTGDLIYLYAPDADGGAAYTFGSAVIIDSYGSVGAWADITLQGQVPHVSYLNSTMSGTSDGIKYASLRNLAQSKVSSSTTTSVTSSYLVGNTAIGVGQYIVLSDGQTRTISGFNSGTGVISWGTALASAPAANSQIRIVSNTTWDHQIIAADPAHAVSDSNQRTNIEVKRNTGTTWTATWGDVAVGYKSDRFELVYLQPEP